MRHARILLADDHQLMMEGIRSVLEPHHEIAGTATDGRELVEMALQLKPDVVILDITMPLLNGLDAAAQIRKALPDAKLLFVTMHVSHAYLQAALTSGGTGYVVKSAAHEELLQAVNRVLEGGIYITPGLSGEDLGRFQDPARAAASLRLTSRERETLQLIAEGRSSKEIAHLLSVSVKTVEFHRENIKRKLGVRTTAELTRHAIDQGLSRA